MSNREISPAWTAVWLATAFGAVLRFVALDDQSLWYDEVYSVQMVKWPLSVILTVRDGHPPLFHVILSAIAPWLGEHSGRVLSAVIGAATIPLLALLGMRFYDRATGSLTAWMLAISPLHVWYSREGRMYALYVLFAVLSSLGVERIVRRGGARSYALWAAAVLGGLLTHYGFTALVVAQVAFLALVTARGARRWRELIPLAIVALGGAIVLMPLARELLRGPIGAERGFSPMGIPYTAFTFLTGFGIGPTITELHWSQALSVMRPYGVEIVATVCVFVVLAVVACKALGHAKRWNAYVLLWLCVPPLLLATRSSVSGTSQNVRYVISSLPAFVLLVAHGLRHERRAVAVAAWALIVVLSAISLDREYFDVRYQREDVRAAAAFLKERVRPEDRIVIAAAEQKLTLGYYMEQSHALEKLPVRVVRTPVEADAALRHWAGRRTWVVLTREWGEDPQHYLRNEIATRDPDALAASFPGVQVYRLEP